MPSHIMLSYQWDDQALVKRIFDRLRDDGLPVWMDIEGGVTGNINDSMAAGVEQAVVICPFMTPAYQASRSCKKELNYADSREVPVVPVMLSNNWEPSEWLGLITARLLWVDFRNAHADEERFEAGLKALEDEILVNVGHLLEQEEEKGDDEGLKKQLKKKPGRGFCHALTKLYICDTGEQLSDTDPDSRIRVDLTETAGPHCYWEEIKGDGCKFYRNVATNRFLGFDPRTERVFSESGPSEESEEWLLLADRLDQSRHRAVVIKNKHSGRFLAIQDGCFVGLESYDEDCKWFLD